MRYVLLIGALVAFNACGSSPTTPTPKQTPAPATAVQPAPIAPATLVVPSDAAFDVPGCSARASLAYNVGLPTIGCASFTGTMVNTGSGCATNIRGTTTIFFNAGGQAGFGGWSYSNLVRPSERFAYAGGTITIPTNGFKYSTTATWDNVRCQ
jgi:hypothetical protein